MEPAGALEGSHPSRLRFFGAARSFNHTRKAANQAALTSMFFAGF